MQGTNLKTTQALKDISQQSTLNQREKHLVGLAVTLTRGCDACTTRRYEEALQSGITKQEIIDLTDLVAMTNAGVVVRTALLSVSDNFSKICEDEVCQVH